jgi:hypothetical protein
MVIGSARTTYQIRNFSPDNSSAQQQMHIREEFSLNEHVCISNMEFVYRPIELSFEILESFINC